MRLADKGLQLIALVGGLQLFSLGRVFQMEQQGHFTVLITGDHCLATLRPGPPQFRYPAHTLERLPDCLRRRLIDR